MKRHAPATQRNRDPIATVLFEELPASGTVLEVASGTGEHAVYFAERFPDHCWQPSDPDSHALESIASWREETGLDNLQAPVRLDASARHWPASSADAILCINMVHISPVEATEGLMAAAGAILEAGAPLILYGPYSEGGVEPAPSNLDFHHSLKARNPAWGLRQIGWMDELAASHGLERTRRVEMPANNLMLIYRRK